MTLSGPSREASAHFYHAVSLKYYASDTQADTPPCHII